MSLPGGQRKTALHQWHEGSRGPHLCQAVKNGRQGTTCFLCLCHVCMDRPVSAEGICICGFADKQGWPDLAITMKKRNGHDWQDGLAAPPPIIAVSVKPAQTRKRDKTRIKFITVLRPDGGEAIHARRARTHALSATGRPDQTRPDQTRPDQQLS
jgi:hypothetical protein